MAIDEFSWTQRIARFDTGNPCTAEAGCITVACDAIERDVFEALGADPSSLRLASFHDAELAWSPQATAVHLWSADNKIILVEPNGFLASLPENLTKIATRGEAVSVFWNVNAQMRVLVVHHGTVLREFDPLLYEDGTPLPEEAGLPFGTDDSLAAALEFLKRRTDFVASENAILAGLKPTYTVKTR